MIQVIIATFFAASGGILFEIFLGSFGSYIFGDSVKVFSLTMGAYMFAMGLGAFSISASIPNPGKKFLYVEAGLIFLHLTSPIIIWIAYVNGVMAVPLFWLTLMISGVLVGAEIPLILGVIREKEGSSDRLVNRVLASDYVGALAASLVFGFWLIERFGLIGAASFSALLEVIAGLLMLLYLRVSLSKISQILFSILFLLTLFISTVSLIKSDGIQTKLENLWSNTMNSTSKVIHHEWTGFSFLTITRQETGEHTLYLNHQYQWTTGKDSQAYHETLVLPAVESFKKTHAKLPSKILVVGGGDGFVADLLFKAYGIQDITVVDIDPRMRELALSIDFWRQAGGDIYTNENIKFLAKDAFEFVTRSKNSGLYDLAIMDLPDPTQPGLARFFTNIFFSKLTHLLSEQGIVSIQASYVPQNAFGREKFVCLVQNILHQQSWHSQAIAGDKFDFFVIGSRKSNQFPQSKSDVVPGKILTSGAHLRWLLTDHLQRFNDNCDRSLTSSLLIPRALGI